MSHKVTIESLPDEMLGCILQYLDWYDRKSAMYVSRRWASAAFGTGLSTVLKIFTSEEAYRKYENIASTTYGFQEIHEALLLSQRSYKNVVLIWDADRTNHQKVLETLSHFSQSVESLKMHSCGCLTDLTWLSSVLGIFPNLKDLDLNGVFIDDDSDAANRIDLHPMDKLRSLHDRQQVVGFIRNAPDVFTNVNALYVPITADVPLADLFRQVGPRLTHLTVYASPNQFSLIADEHHFPMLESLEVSSEDERIHTAVEHLGRFVRNASKLKNLKLRARVDTSFLRLLDPLYGTLQSLTFYVDILDFGVLQLIQNFKNLKQLWIQGINLVDFHSLKDGPPALQSVRDVTLECYETVPHFDQFYRNCFPNLTTLELQFEDPDDHCVAIANQAPALRRLVIRNPYYDAKLQPFLEFCSKLKVPELHVYCCSLEKGEWDPSLTMNYALHLRKLVIDAIRIDPDVYTPMILSIPKLRRLELALRNICENNILRTLLFKFPGCDVVRMRKSDGMFLSEMV